MQRLTFFLLTQTFIYACSLSLVLSFLSFFLSNNLLIISNYLNIIHHPYIEFPITFTSGWMRGTLLFLLVFSLFMRNRCFIKMSIVQIATVQRTHISILPKSWTKIKTWTAHVCGLYTWQMNCCMCEHHWAPHISSILGIFSA